MAFQRHLAVLVLASVLATPAAFAAAPAVPETAPMSLGQCLRQDPATLSEHCLRKIELAKWRAGLADASSTTANTKNAPVIIIPPGYIPGKF